jgi:hypothetical protein
LVPGVAVCTACCYQLTAPEPEPVTPDWREVARADPGAHAEVEDPGPQPQVRKGFSLGIPSNRAAAFRPVRVSDKPPPPNPFRAAEERQRNRLRKQTTDGELPAVPTVQAVPQWSEPDEV